MEIFGCLLRSRVTTALHMASSKLEILSPHIELLFLLWSSQRLQTATTCMRCMLSREYIELRQPPNMHAPARYGV